MEYHFAKMTKNKLKNKGHDENHSPFTFSFHHIQLDITVAYSLDAEITTDIDKSISYSIHKSIRYCIDKTSHKAFRDILYTSSVKQMEKLAGLIYLMDTINNK